MRTPYFNTLKRIRPILLTPAGSVLIKGLLVVVDNIQDNLFLPWLCAKEQMPIPRFKQ
jgi:hypothetical protein